VPQAESNTSDTTRPSLEVVYRYHDGTKHHFDRFARSLGYLDWASQPRPFRAFAGAATFPLYPSPGAAGDAFEPRRVTFDEARRLEAAAAPLSAAVVGDVLRHALGLSAWKAFKTSRWSLRVNPSSGNLHPTEAYLVAPALAGLADLPAVYHYAPDRHLVELRCLLDHDAWNRAFAGRGDVVLIALTSIQWREAWKYGERAFRYCQHDLGHAIAAVSVAAAAVGWHARLLPAWPHRAVAAIAGVDREGDFVEAEHEDAACVIALGQSPPECSAETVDGLVASARRGTWSGRASQLSEDHVTWSFIDEVSRATNDPGQSGHTALQPAASTERRHRDRPIDVRRLVRQRRSAVAFDARTTIDRVTFAEMLSSTLPAAGAPLAAAWWTPRVHLAVFVHRVDGIPPGLYMLVRDPQSFDRLRAACRSDFLWEPADPAVPLWLLAPTDVRALSTSLSCDQDIAADGFFSLGMLADFDTSLETFGPSFYRHLFWETGIVGQILYLEAEAAGARGTGIGCFYDDPVHRVLGLNGHAFQSLYHFTVGQPVEDTRLTTQPGYEWEIDRT
jgi:SagB-type dehydrogenase family enzyme